MYLSLRKKPTDENLFINSYGRFDEKSGLYEITLDFAKDMEHLNGEYEM